MFRSINVCQNVNWKRDVFLCRDCSPIKEEVQKEEITAEKKEEEGVHHATVANVTGDGESASLESYGTCAVALYDYQVK